MNSEKKIQNILLRNQVFSYFKSSILLKSDFVPREPTGTGEIRALGTCPLKIDALLFYCRLLKLE